MVDMEAVDRMSESLRNLNEQLIESIHLCAELEANLDSLIEKFGRLRMETEDISLPK